MKAFRSVLEGARNVLVLTGAGISAESGVPTFRGEGGLWRSYRSEDLATPYAFYDNPGLVWEFYHYRRELVRQKEPNAGHLALAKAEDLFTRDRRSFTVITQNVDGLHLRAGSKNVIELHDHLLSIPKHIRISQKKICLVVKNPPHSMLPEFAMACLDRMSSGLPSLSSLMFYAKWTLPCAA
ncbi:unnamed protein product [Dicrocoelium dendriticum]|nr:unnamed protein product [Dicrocoelium dendriticum]